MKAVLETALGERAAILLAEGPDSVEAVRAGPRGGMILLVIGPTVPKPDRAMLLAALGPLAVELAPETRLNALDLGERARGVDAVAAAEFLVTALSTTGQVLRVSA